MIDANVSARTEADPRIAGGYLQVHDEYRVLDAQHVFVARHDDEGPPARRAQGLAGQAGTRLGRLAKDLRLESLVQVAGEAYLDVFDALIDGWRKYEGLFTQLPVKRFQQQQLKQRKSRNPLS